MTQLSQLIIDDFNAILVSRINAEGPDTNCILRFYTGTRPTNPAFAPTGANIIVINLPHPAIQVFSDGLSLLTNSISTTALASGRVTWWRLTNRNSTTIMDGSIGLTGSKSDIELNTIDLEPGNIIRFTRNHTIRYGC